MWILHRKVVNQPQQTFVMAQMQGLDIIQATEMHRRLLRTRVEWQELIWRDKFGNREPVERITTHHGL